MAKAFLNGLEVGASGQEPGCVSVVDANLGFRPAFLWAGFQIRLQNQFAGTWPSAAAEFAGTALNSRAVPASLAFSSAQPSVSGSSGAVRFSAAASDW